MLESDDGDLGRNYREARHPALTADANKEAPAKRPKFPTIHPDDERKPRTEQVMEKEAMWLAQRMSEAELD